MVIFQPKYQLHHPGNYLFSIPKKSFLDQSIQKTYYLKIIKIVKIIKIIIIIIIFENRSNIKGLRARVLSCNCSFYNEIKIVRGDQTANPYIRFALPLGVTCCVSCSWFLSAVACALKRLELFIESWPLFIRRSMSMMFSSFATTDRLSKSSTRSRACCSCVSNMLRSRVSVGQFTLKNSYFIT